MKVPVEIKPALWGAAGGALATMIVGFAWGGWVTGGTSEKNAGTAAQTAVEQTFVPFCVALAQQQPAQIALLKKETTWGRREFIVKAGWVSNMAEKYQRNVAEGCAAAIVETVDTAVKS